MTTHHVELLNATRSEIEEQLLNGKSPAEVAQDLQELMPNVLTIFHDLRDDGRIGAGNHPPGTAPAPRAVPTGSASALVQSQTSALIERGQKHSSPKIRTLADKAYKALASLHFALTEDDKTAEARAKIERLEKELADAKAALRKPKGTSSSAPATAPAGEGHACAKCSKKLPTDAGRKIHESRCKAA